MANDYTAMTHEDLVSKIIDLEATGKCPLLIQRDEEIDELNEKLEEQDNLVELVRSIRTEFEYTIADINNLYNELYSANNKLMELTDILKKIYTDLEDSTMALDNIACELDIDA